MSSQQYEAHQRRNLQNQPTHEVEANPKVQEHIIVLGQTKSQFLRQRASASQAELKPLKDFRGMGGEYSDCQVNASSVY